MPVRDSEVILGKYLASFGVVLVLLTMTLLYPFAMFKWPWHLGALDWGPVWAGYLGCVFFALAAVGIGMMISSLTESDVIAFFLTAAALVFLYAIGLLVASLHLGVLGDARRVRLVLEPLPVVHARPHRHPRTRLLPVGGHPLPARELPLAREPQVVVTSSRSL